MIENFLLGAGSKLVANLVNNWMANQAEARRSAELRAIQDHQVIMAHANLAKENNKGFISQLTRGVIYIMITVAFCYMGYYGIHNPDAHDVLVPVRHGFLSKLFDKADIVRVQINGSVLLYQWWELMQMILGAFVIPSRKR